MNVVEPVIAAQIEIGRERCTLTVTIGAHPRTFSFEAFTTGEDSPGSSP